MVRERHARWRSRGASKLVPYAIHDGLTQIGEQRTFAAILEAIELVEGLDERVLYEIGGIAQVTRPLRQPPMGEALQIRPVARQQRVQRIAIAAVDAVKQLARRIGGGALPHVLAARPTGVGAGHVEGAAIL